jgi:hypothetical protein
VGGTDLHRGRPGRQPDLVRRVITRQIRSVPVPRCIDTRRK